MVIAIDGPAGSGKSSVARGVAEALSFTYLDSGAMYRCVALAALRRGADLSDGRAVGAVARSARIEVSDGIVRLDGEDVSRAIRTPAVTEAASVAAAHPEVRAEMVNRQRRAITRGKWVVEGRDIGSVVAEDAPLKVFLTASDEERARRRAVEIGEDVDRVLAAQAERDGRDITRASGALVIAEDAIEIDTTNSELPEVIERVVELARERGLT
jgi:CMP/dCMP kinase